MEASRSDRSGVAHVNGRRSADIIRAWSLPPAV
jgi:hypothetical protein